MPTIGLDFSRELCHPKGREIGMEMTIYQDPSDDTLVFDADEIPFPKRESHIVHATVKNPLWITFDGEWILDNGEW